MNNVCVYDRTTRKQFIKEFNDIREQRRFIIRCDKGHKLVVLSYTWDSEDEYEYLTMGR